jgi:hypothetical protein
MYAQPTILRVSALYLGAVGWARQGCIGGEIGRGIDGASGEGGGGAAEGDRGGACSRGGLSDVAWVAGANANANSENVAHAATSHHAHGAVAEFANEKGDRVVI